jgi:hypothetical protein
VKDVGEVQLVVGQGLFPLEALGPAHRYGCPACVWQYRRILLCKYTRVAQHLVQLIVTKIHAFSCTICC